MDDYMSATSEAAVVAMVFGRELARNAIILIYHSDLAKLKSTGGKGKSEHFNTLILAASSDWGHAQIRGVGTGCRDIAKQFWTPA
jgi:hypothetical protein